MSNKENKYKMNLSMIETKNLHKGIFNKPFRYERLTFNIYDDDGHLVLSVFNSTRKRTKNTEADHSFGYFIEKILNDNYL